MCEQVLCRPILGVLGFNANDRPFSAAEWDNASVIPPRHLALVAMVFALCKYTDEYTILMAG